MGLNRFSLNGKRALVTGASRGIGRALAIALAEAGADVALVARRSETLAETVKGIEGVSRKACAIGVDVRDVEGCRRAVAGTIAAFGGIDVLINNAGVEQVSPSLDVDEALWDKIVDTNLKGAFFMAQAAAREMKGGAILNLCSLTSERGIPTAVPYGSSKTGLLGMTRALAAEWASRGVRVNAIAPGYFRTDMTEVFYANADWQKSMLGKIPMGRFGEMDDLCGAAIFLCSDAAQYVTGVCLPVDGGTLASI
jgi:NAD(P)-dependent dehydrogenase (short-subunit alcohol dehydrogenase family)